MVAFHPGLSQTTTVQYGQGHQAVEITFTATEGDLAHLELWTDFSDGEWKAIPFVVDEVEDGEATEAVAASERRDAILIESSLPPLPGSGAVPTIHQARAKTTVTLLPPATAQSFSYTFRRSPNGNVEWLGHMGSNGTIIFEKAEIGHGSIFEKALNSAVQVDHEQLDGVRGVGIQLVDGTPSFQYLPSSNQASLSLILLEPSHPPPSFYNYIPFSPWSRAVIATSTSPKVAKLAAAAKPSASFASCLNRIDPNSAFKPATLNASSKGALGLWYDQNLIVYDPSPSLATTVYTVQHQGQAAVFTDGKDQAPTFVTGDIHLRQASAASVGPLGKVLQVIQAQKLNNTLICAPGAVSFTPAAAAAAVASSTEPSFWARLAQSFKTFWTVYVLGLFTSAFRASSVTTQEQGDESEEDEDRTVVGERTPLLRHTSPAKAAAAGDQVKGYDYTFAAPPYTFAISDFSALDRLRFTATEQGDQLSTTTIAQNSTAALISVQADAPQISVRLA